MCDPFALEVHPSISTGHSDLESLPPYLPRAHDSQVRVALEQVVTQGRSRMLTLVGDSSTGKTRCCWEALNYLDKIEPGRWRVWHPFDPTGPDALLHALDRVGPQTVIWLNEAQRYLGGDAGMDNASADPELKERVAAGLRSLLVDHDRGPVLIMATVWPDYWTRLTHRPASGPDGHANARELLTGTDIGVPEKFSADQVGLLGDDPRLRLAAAQAEHGRITQFLAGAPELLRRYRDAYPAARAILDGAIDARRFGHPLALPLALLAGAAPGYLDDQEWDRVGQDWLDQALAYAGEPCHGARGLLTQIRPRPGEPTGPPTYRLADYLEQSGGRSRAAAFPPGLFWDTATAVIADPDTLAALGHSAHERGRFGRAVQLWQHAAHRGHARALTRLAKQQFQAGDIDKATALYREAADRGDNFALSSLAYLRQQSGDLGGATSLYRQAVSRGYTPALNSLARLSELGGDVEGATDLYETAANRGDHAALSAMVLLRHRIGDADGAARWTRIQAASNSYSLVSLGRLREQAGDLDGAATLYKVAAGRGSTHALSLLARHRQQAGEPDGEVATYRQAADGGIYTQGGDEERAFFRANALTELGLLRERAGDDEGAASLYKQAVDLGDTTALAWLAGLLEEKGDIAGAVELAREAAGQGDGRTFTWVAWLREQAGDVELAASLYRETFDIGDIDAMIEVVMQRWEDGDIDGAAVILREAVNRGYDGVNLLADLQDDAGDPDTARRLRRFGLTDEGDPAQSLSITAGP